MTTFAGLFSGLSGDSGKRLKVVEDADRRKVLLGYVQEVEPSLMEQFADQAPAQVVEAMRTTVTNMLGTLPPQFFQVTISTVGENLAQLMFSVMMTGYMFRNAQYRVDLRQQIAPLASGENHPLASISDHSSADLDALIKSAGSSSSGLYGSSSGSVDSAGSGGSGSLHGDEYAPGTQTSRVQGEVLRWHLTSGAESIPAVQYIEALETEIATLKRQLSMQTKKWRGNTLSGYRVHNGGNELLDYLKGLEPASLQELTDGAGPEVLEAMNSFIQRLLGTGDEEELREHNSESNAVELARLLYWLMVVGYSLRSMEVRLDMEVTMDCDAPGPSTSGWGF